MKRGVRGALQALGAFSILPVGSAANEAPGGSALAWLPAIGVLVGAVAGVSGVAVAHIAGIVAGSWVLIALAWLLTGGIHLDGFLDGCDGLFAAVAPERRREIMRDPRHGSFALIGMALLAGAWWIAASRLLESAHTVGTGGGIVRAVVLCALACGAARLAALAAAAAYRYVQDGAYARALAKRPAFRSIAVWFVLFEALAATRGLFVAFVPAVTIIAALFLGRWCASRLGGALNGDVYGFIIAVFEPLGLFAAALLAR